MFYHGNDRFFNNLIVIITLLKFGIFGAYPKPLDKG